MKLVFYREMMRVAAGQAFMQFVDFVGCEVDLVENPYYGTYDSDSVRWYLNKCGCDGPWVMIDGYVSVNHLQILQTVTVELQNPEDAVKLKLLSDFVSMLATNIFG